MKQDWEKETDYQTESGRKNFTLISGNHVVYLVLIANLEFCERIQQYVPLKYFYKYFENENKNDITRAVLKSLRSNFEDFKTSNYFLFIDYFEKYTQKIHNEFQTESDPVKKEKLKEILLQFGLLNQQVFKHPDKPHRSVVRRENFVYTSCSKAFTYAENDTILGFDLIPNSFDNDELNKRLKAIFTDIDEIGKTFEASDIIYEIGKSKEILAQLSEGKSVFKIDFKSVGAIKRVNLIRLMKYWELKGYIIVDDWLGDDTGWNIIMLGGEEVHIVTTFLEKIEHRRKFLGANILETRYEQELLNELRGFNYESISDDEIFLGKIKKLKKHPQTIWITDSSRGYSTQISQYILEWEEILREYPLPDGKLSTLNKNVLSNKELYFDDKTGSVTFGGKLLGTISLQTREYNLFKVLFENYGKFVSQIEIYNYVKGAGKLSTSKDPLLFDLQKYCSDIKGKLNKNISKYIHRVKGGYQITGKIVKKQHGKNTEKKL